MDLIKKPQIHDGETIHALSTDSDEFLSLSGSRDRVDHILLFQPKEEQKNKPTIAWYSPEDTVYIREGTEIKDLPFWEGERVGYELTYKGETHQIYVEAGDDNPELQFQEIKKRFFKEENVNKFIKKFVDDDGNAQQGSGERGLTILNVKKKDIWQEIADDTNKGRCEGKQVLFKGSGRDDVLVGNACNNVLIGGKGDDILDGKGGDDFLIGGRGKDTFVYSGGKDVIVNFDEENDRLDMGNLQYGIDYIVEEFTNPVGDTGLEFIFA